MHHRLTPLLAALAAGALITLGAYSPPCAAASRYLLHVPVAGSYLTAFSDEGASRCL